jgi:hypothetical protein
MSTYEDTLLAARFAALAPEPLLEDWDDVLDRAGTVRPRRRRLARSIWRGGRRRKLVVALAVAVVVAVGAAAAYGTVRVLFLDRGFIGLPPLGATPSAPESGELVVHWSGISATLPQEPHRLFVRTWVYADGRIIWDRRPFQGQDRATGRIPEGANELTSGYLEQRLTPEGLELVRSDVAGLFDRSRTLLETVAGDDDPFTGESGGGLALRVPTDYDGWGTVEVPDGDRRVRLQWSAIAGDAGERAEEAFWRARGFGVEGTIATQEQLSALRRVDALLTNPASVLPSSAWAVREARAYVPSHYAVCIYTSPPADVSHVLSLLPARAEELLRDTSRTRSERDLIEAGGTVIGRSVTYCFEVETEAAREVAEAVSGLDPEPGWASYGLAYRVAEAVNHLDPTRIVFEPYFPHGQFTYSGPSG